MFGENMPQHYSIVMLFIARPEDQRDWPLAGQPKQLIELFGMMLELGQYTAPSKLVPVTDIVPEPSSQFGAWREFPEPVIDSGLLLSHAARPQPVDEDTRAVGGRRLLVRPLEPDVELRRRRGHYYLPDILVWLSAMEPKDAASMMTAMRDTFPILRGNRQ